MRRARTTLEPCWFCRETNRRLLVRFSGMQMHVQCANQLGAEIEAIR